MATYHTYLQAKEELRQTNEELYNDIMQGRDTDMLEEWPEFFNPDEYIQSVDKTKLKQAPRAK